MAGRVRQPIDIKALEAYLNKNVPDINTPIDIKQFGFGQSNPTYQLTGSDGARFVLRKKPPGRLVSKTAHKVEREYRIIHALSRHTDVPVPRAYALCEDASVVGTAFYIMEFLDGRIITDPAMPEARSPAERHAMWADAVRTLARLHAVDPDAAGLASFGRRGGFYARQIATWSAICAAQAAARDADSGEPVGDLPHFNDMVRFFADAARQPRDRATLVHGDFKIDNLVFHKTEPRVIGILDWEMSTIGHPLSDLANLLTPFYTARLHAAGNVVSAHAAFLPGATPGLPNPSEIADLYESAGAAAGAASTTTEVAKQQRHTRDREMQWAQAFNMMRQAAICQGIAARHAVRQASSEAARRYAEARAPLAELAWDLVRGIEEDDDDGASGGGGGGAAAKL